jgi:Fibrinogen beta and gamma chains, C-terminal globular domain
LLFHANCSHFSKKHYVCLLVISPSYLYNDAIIVGLVNFLCILTTGSFNLQVVYNDGSLASAMYWSFSIDSEAKFYKITVSGYDGKIGGDALDKDAGIADLVSNGQPFSTFDRDKDGTTENCAQLLGGGWWYKWCSSSALNRDNLGSWLLIWRVMSSRMAICRI